MPADLTDDLARQLAAPFDDREVKFKPQAVKGNRALAIAYVDARVIMDRLDEVVGTERWQDRYRLLPQDSVMCRLSVRCGDRWVTKTDVGSPSEQPDGGDRMKASFSDALKRAAVKFGLGRYLYRLPQVWADWDPAKKQFVAPPQLPAWARAGGKPAKAVAAPFAAHKAALANAANLGALKAAFGAVNADEKLSADEKIDLSRLKDQRKAELAKERA